MHIIPRKAEQGKSIIINKDYITNTDSIVGKSTRQNGSGIYQHFSHLKKRLIALRIIINRLSLGNQ